MIFLTLSRRLESAIKRREQQAAEFQILIDQLETEHQRIKQLRKRLQKRLKTVQ